LLISVLLFVCWALFGSIVQCDLGATPPSHEAFCKLFSWKIRHLSA